MPRSERCRMLVSVYARKPRSAVLLAYLIEAVWLLGPWIADNAMLTGRGHGLGLSRP